ncbi:MAG: hypothetical protein LBP98_00645 [Tannerella sp.]|jgi:hypothetical protein|nr:hypothetical protein [Tannerella sp.]
MKKREKLSAYIKANRRGCREAELEVSAGWTAKTKVHRNKKKYDRKDRSWRNNSGLLIYMRLIFCLRIRLLETFIPQKVS